MRVLEYRITMMNVCFCTCSQRIVFVMLLFRDTVIHLEFILVYALRCAAINFDLPITILGTCKNFSKLSWVALFYA